MLLSVVPVDGIWVVANFWETQVARMRIGERAHVWLTAFQDGDRGRIDSWPRQWGGFQPVAA
jgi:membrane fusion protein (multidrug efflux system)